MSDFFFFSFDLLQAVGQEEGSCAALTLVALLRFRQVQGSYTFEEGCADHKTKNERGRDPQGKKTEKRKWGWEKPWSAPEKYRGKTMVLGARPQN